MDLFWDSLRDRLILKWRNIKREESLGRHCADGTDTDSKKNLSDAELYDSQKKKRFIIMVLHRREKKVLIG